MTSSCSSSERLPDVAAVAAVGVEEQSKEEEAEYSEYESVPGIPFCGHSIDLETSRYFRLPDGSPGQGFWRAAVTLAHVIRLRTAVEGKRVVELGSGLGTVGVALALLGANVTATEQQVVYDKVLRRNAESYVRVVVCG